jgi:Cu2+-exporting ATPase
MNAGGVYLVHALPGRVRLKMERLRQNPLLADEIQRTLPTLSGIDDVVANPETGSLLIHYDRCLSTSLDFHLSVASALGVSPGDFDIAQLSSLLQSQAEHPAHDHPASSARDPETRPVLIGTTLAATSIVHAITGRVRLRLPALSSRPQLLEPLEVYLRDQNGITEVRVNHTCESATILFDPAVWTPESLCAFLQRLSHEEIEAYQPKPSHKPAPLVVEETSGPELWLSSAGIALSLTAEAIAAPVLPILLLMSAWPMLKRAYNSIAVDGKLNVDVLDASATAVLTTQGNLPMATFMVWLINIADYIRDATMMQSKRAIEEVLAYRTHQAWVVRDGQKVRVTVGEIRTGETVVAYPGERITVDGTVESGKAMVDQATLTGESLPVEKGEGDLVFASTVIREGKLYIRAERIGDETEAARIVRLVEEAPARETKIQNYAVKWANDLVPYSFLGAGVAAGLGGGLQGAAAVLIVDYGTGIRIAAPTVVLSSMTKAIRHGILIKGGRHLENLAEVDAVVFDKTGTLTSGHPDVVDIVPAGHASADEVLAFAAAAEQRLTHPVADAILRAAHAKGLTIPERSTSDYTLGLGVESCVDGRAVLVGSRRFMTQKGITISKKIQKELRDIEQQAVSPLCVAVDGSILGVLSYADPLRPEAPEVIEAIRQRGIKDIVMLTGDHKDVAKRIADHLGITRYTAEAFPGEKAEAVRSLQREGRKVAVVGDGINDSPALAHADVGIAVDGGTEVARETAHVVLLHGGLWKIPHAIDIGREAVGLIQQNWKIISIPNTIALGLAVVGILGPIGSTLLSNGSAIVATFNGLRPILDKPGDRPLTIVNR